MTGFEVVGVVLGGISTPLPIWERLAGAVLTA